MVRRFSDFTLTGQEHQHISALQGVTPQLVQCISNGLIHAVVTRLLKGLVANLNGKCSSRDMDYWCRSFDGGKVLGKTIRINGGGGDDDFKIGSSR